MKSNQKIPFQIKMMIPNLKIKRIFYIIRMVTITFQLMGALPMNKILMLSNNVKIQMKQSI